MQIEKKTLKRFLEKISIVNEGILNFEEQGVSLRQMTTDNVGMVEAKFADTNFIEYAKINKIAIDNFFNFRAFIDLFGDILNFKKEKNYLSFKDTDKEGEFFLTSTEYLKQSDKKIDIKYKSVFTLKSSILKDIVKSSLVTNVGSNTPTLRFQIKDNNLIIETGEVNKIRCIIAIKEKVEDCNVKFGELLCNCINLLDDNDVTISLGNNLPINIEEKSDITKIKYMVAPRIDNK